MMKIKAIRLPWAGKEVPHGVIDIIRGCNITCPSCYNQSSNSIKSLLEIELELDVLTSKRNLYSVSILGGEVLLHPDIVEIIKAIKRRGLAVEICTNGLLLDKAMALKLKESGLDFVLMHIEPRQKRADLIAPRDMKGYRQLCESKALLCASLGLDLGLSVTGYRSYLCELKEIIQMTLESPIINFLLITSYRDHSSIKKITGDIETSLMAEMKLSGSNRASDELGMERILSILKDDLKLAPFSYMGSNLDEEDPRWVSLLISSLIESNGRVSYASVLPSLFECLYMAFIHYCKKRHSLNNKQNRGAFRTQLILNGLLGGNFLSNLQTLWKSFRRDSTLLSKKILIQNLAEILPDGRVIHCRCCPDAVLKNNRLVPVCLCDFIEN